MHPAETAHCADCFAVSFTDEMNRCSSGHYTCPACSCDCDFLLERRPDVPEWLREEVIRLEELSHGPLSAA